MTNRMRMTALTSLLGVAALAAGCASADSGDVNTDAIYGDLEVTSGGAGTTTAKAALKVGGAASNTFLDLEPGDTLLATANEETKVMQRMELLGAVWYESVFATSSAGTAFRIAFLRTHTGGDECTGASAPDSNVTLPAPFAITSPAQDTSFSRTADAITVDWSPSGESDPMSWSIAGNCIVSQYGNALPSDDGTLTIPAGSIQPQESQGATSCQATITLHRSRDGNLDPNYGEGGRIRARQERTLRILSAP